MKQTIKKMQKAMEETLMHVIDPNQGQLKIVPNHILALTLFLCINVLLQGIADLALKFLSYSPLLSPLPWRTDFLFLTAVSVLMGYRSFMGMRHRKFDVTRNSIELGLLVETGLVVGDTLFIMQHIADIPEVLPMRLPFIIFTAINMVILLYTYHALQLRKWLENSV
jgi:hypothetical protein